MVSINTYLKMIIMVKCKKCGILMACPVCSEKMNKIDNELYDQMKKERRAKKIVGWQCTNCLTIYVNKQEAIDCCD